MLINHGSEPLARLGAGYELETAHWAITPKVYVDFVHGDTPVGLGVAVGRRF